MPTLARFVAFAIALGFANPAFANDTIEKTGKIANPAISESSGLALSRSYDGVLWTHNDSGDAARIFAIDKDGNDVGPPEGIRIEGVENTDWEDLAVDNSGNLYIGDFGNNGNARKNLAVHVIREPDPRKDRVASVAETRRFHYPDQTAFPAKKRNFDCEAMFWANDTLYFLTKHRSNRKTKLYRMDRLDPMESTPLTLLETFDSRGRVTAADATPDGKRIAILTYHDIYVFEKPDTSDRYLSGNSASLFIRAAQCESLAWIDANRILVGNEQQSLYQVDARSLR